MPLGAVSAVSKCKGVPDVKSPASMQQPTARLKNLLARAWGLASSPRVAHAARDGERATSYQDAMAVQGQAGFSRNSGPFVFSSR